MSPRITRLALLALALVACRAAPGEPAPTLVPELEQIDDPPADASAAILEPELVRVYTYDGSGELVHPDAVVFPHSWKGMRYWYAATPYPFGNAAFENPSSYAGNSRDDWHLPAGVRNPLAMPEKGAYLSDPDLSYDLMRGELRLYYRQTTNTGDQIFLKTSRDGSTWSDGTLVLEDARYNAISPAIVREADGSWRMWTVGARLAGCHSTAAKLELRERRSKDGVTWGPATPVSLTVPANVPWHWDVQWISARHEYWALVAAFPEGTDCSHTAVFFARSADGTNWVTEPRPLLAPHMVDALEDLVYRSTFRYFSDGDLVTVWFSGARREGFDFHYSMATARYPLDELLRRVGPVPSANGLPRQAVPKPEYADSVARAAFAEMFP